MGTDDNQPSPKPGQLTFTLQAESFPSGWNGLLKELECRKSDRQTEDFPVWWRIDGKGYTFWLSEIRLADSTVTPPVWQITLESLATLPPAGQEHFDLCSHVIDQFLQHAKPM